MNVREQNIKNWEEKVKSGNRWTVPVGPDEIRKARMGEWSVCVTQTKTVPRNWFPPLAGKDILCLASGGGQQGPVLAAAGGRVTVVDISEAQLRQDRTVAEREGLSISTVLSDMADLGAFGDGSFDIIVHPVSNLYIPDVRPVWREAFRVLRDGGVMISGFMNPVFYMFDWDMQERGVLLAKHRIPYSDLDYLSAAELQDLGCRALEFGHTLEAQIQGQIDAGFIIGGFYEDTFGGERLIDRYCSSFAATLAIRRPSLT